MYIDLLILDISAIWNLCVIVNQNKTVMFIWVILDETMDWGKREQNITSQKPKLIEPSTHTPILQISLWYLL